MSAIRKFKAFAHLPIIRKDALEYKDMSTAFDYISKEIEKHLPEQTIQIVVSGGTCSVLYFRTRDKTKDIDFFVPDPDVIEIVSAVQHTLPEDLKQRWPKNWVNSEMAGYATMPNCENLYENSIANNVILYRSASLVVYAADWKFQVIGKIIRAHQMELLKEQKQSIERGDKDIRDAVSILHELVMQNQGPLHRNQIRSWYNGSALEDNEIEYVNAAFNTRFNFNAIV